MAQAEAATPNRCCCYFLRGSYLMPVALETPPSSLPPAPSLVSCAEAPPPPVPWRPGLAPLARALRWSSSRLFPCGNGTALNDPPLVYDRRNSGTNGGGGIAACGCNTGARIPTLPPSSSSAFGVNSLPCASSNKLPVHRSPGGNRLIVRGWMAAKGSITLAHRTVGKV